ncbi:MAG: alpha-hydroxy-acid oxidizing protein, partial [Acidobacteriaceae bacterium]|nr:alpha-hydroxy-acid oxidizing protein [Acidobacteriaceae bacterium]
MQVSACNRGRREFLRFLAGSPLIAAHAAEPPLSDPKHALDVMDFEEAARAALPPAHFGYMATGVDDDLTLKANRDGFRKLQLRPRRLVDVSRIDTRVELFGETYESPIFICPTGNQKAFHPEGELAVAKAAHARKHLMVLSTVTNTPIEEVIQAAGRPVWFQLYATNSWPVAEKITRHAEQAGCRVMALTVDTTTGRNTETLDRSRRLDKWECTACHTAGGFYQRKPMFAGMDMQGISTGNASMTWEIIRKLRGVTKMKLLIKGIETREDAVLCREYGVDGIVVSNHGGRAEESGRGTIECLPEVLDGAGKMPVLIDGGFRRGSDVYKGLALGAKAVGIGRPYLWGLASFGQPGVERVLQIMQG